ncbi:MAG: type II toxin-antitoxin system HicB family antitoxin [Azoarcus sp.]|jgi:predicted HicB family RNase H-like nuclease|nr:type II toxin-antitoxin system HicB family antitoxin [Azoarcus sp.]
MNVLLNHRGYYGSIEASPEDDCLFGKLQFVRALVTYEGRTVHEIEQAFREAVDDYLADCGKEGRAPELPCKGSFNVRLGHDLHLAACMEAARKNLTLNELTRRAISAYIEDEAVSA